MDVGARNRLLECVGCHSLYHQECHRPAVSLQEADTDWLCRNCKVDRYNKLSEIMIYETWQLLHGAFGNL